LYLNGSRAVTSGSALTFDGTNLDLATVGAKVNFATTSSATRNYVGGAADGFSLEMVTQRGASQPLSYKQNYAVGHEWGIAGSIPMTLDASGRLLIGSTSAPSGSSVKTSIVGGASGGASSALQLTYNGGTYGGALIGAIEQGGGLQFYTFTGNVSAETYIERARIDTSGTLILRQSSNAANTSVSFNTTVQNALTLDSDGDLGIGTNSPNQKLHVENNANSSTWIKVANTNGGSGAAAGVLFTNNGGDLGAISLLSSANIPANSLFLRSLSTNTLTFGTANTVQATLDTSGNLGLGVSPSTWASNFVAMQIGPGATVNSASDGRAAITSNIFIASGPTAKYIANGFGAAYTQLNGAHLWFTAPNNTSGPNIDASGGSTTMTLDASGDLAIGTTTGSIFSTSGVNVSVSNPSGIATIAIAGSTGNSGYLELGQGSVRGALIEGTTNAMIFYTNATGSGTSVTERARITSTGNFGIGTNDPNSFGKLAVVDTNRSGTALFVVRDEGTPSVNLVSISANAIGTALSVNSVGNTTALNIGVGGTAPTTSGTGITFPATQSASSDANTLDDYEEGVHTAVITTETSGTVTLSGTEDVISYTKIGRQVTVIGGLVVASVASPVGFFYVSLPFAIGDLSEFSGRASGSVTVNDGNGPNVADFVVLALEGESGFRVYLGDAASVQADSANALQTGAQIYVSFTYFV
jgi:hypothetical protein